MANISLANVETILHIAAILVGGVWVYFNFLRGRTFRPRLEFELSNSSVRRAGSNYVTLKYAAKNVGLSRVSINHGGSGLRILTTDPIRPRIMISPDWKHLGTYPIFENQDWVEPGETIFEEQLIVLPDDNAAAIKLELKLASSRSAWVAVTVSLLAKDEEGPTHGATATEPGATTTPATAAGRATAQQQQQQQQQQEQQLLQQEIRGQAKAEETEKKRLSSETTSTDAQKQ